MCTTLAAGKAAGAGDPGGQVVDRMGRGAGQVLATKKVEMAGPSITSTRWLARVGLVAGLVVLAAICGVGVPHVLVLAIATLAIVTTWAIGRRVAQLLELQIGRAHV